MTELQTAASSSEDALACCPFRLGDALLLCPAANVEAVTMWEEPLTLPRVPAHVLGLVTYDQRALAVLDLGRFLGITRAAAYTRTLVVTAGGFRVGVPIDSVLGVVVVPCSDRQPPTGAIAGPVAQYLTSQVTLDGDLAGLLDFERLLEAARV